MYRKERASLKIITSASENENIKMFNFLFGVIKILNKEDGWM